MTIVGHQICLLIWITFALLKLLSLLYLVLLIQILNVIVVITQRTSDYLLLPV